MPCFGIVSDHLGGGTDNAEDTAGAVYKRQILALDGAKGLCGGGIAGKNDQGAPHLKEPFYALEGIFMDGSKRTVTIGCTGIITQIDIIILWEELADRLEHRETAVAGVEDAYGRGVAHAGRR